MQKIYLIIIATIIFTACVPEEVPEPSTTTSWYKDVDGDTYGDPATEVVSTNKPDNTYVADNTDCDDLVTGASINPGAAEVNDEIDNNCDGVINDAPFVVGDFGPSGGIVFITDGSNGHEAAPEDQDDGAGAEWGCFNSDIAGAGGTAVGTGAQNSADILAAVCSPETGGNPLATELVDAYSLNGYNDWFLPSLDELSALYTLKDVVGGFSDAEYWSSSEASAVYAQAVYFSEDEYGNFLKYSFRRVRAIRSF